MNKAKVSLQTSEGLIFKAAAQIYAAYLQLGKISDGQEREWMERSLKDAIQLAQMADRMVQSDSEMD